MSDPPNASTGAKSDASATSSGSGGANPIQNIPKPSVAEALKKSMKKNFENCTKRNEKPLKISARMTTPRTYKLGGQPPTGFLHHVETRFKSLATDTYVKYYIRGEFVPCLYLAFDMTHKEYTNDMLNSSEFSVMINNREITLKAMDKEDLDRDGNMVDRHMKSLVLNEVHPIFETQQKFLVEAFKEFIDFPTETPFTSVGENGRFRGKMVAPVEKFKLLPNRKFRVPMVYFDTAANDYVKSSSSFTEILVGCVGHDKTEAGPKRQQITVKNCNYCKKDGHWVKDCPRLRNRWKCRNCGRSDKGCTSAECNLKDDIEKGIFNTEPREKRTGREQVTFAEHSSFRRERFTERSRSRSRSRKRTRDGDLAHLPASVDNLQANDSVVVTGVTNAAENKQQAEAKPVQEPKINITEVPTADLKQLEELPLTKLVYKHSGYIKMATLYLDEVEKEAFQKMDGFEQDMIKGYMKFDAREGKYEVKAEFVGDLQKIRDANPRMEVDEDDDF